MTGRMGAALSSPFSTSMTWTQLAAVVVFITVVLFAWRQVILFVGREI
jgi:hypothetical protein